MSLQAIFDPMVRAYFKNKSGGGDRGEIIGFNYCETFPDINTVWTDELKKIWPVAALARVAGKEYRLLFLHTALAFDNQGKRFYAREDIRGQGAYLENGVWHYYGDPTDEENWLFDEGQTAEEHHYFLFWQSEPAPGIEVDDNGRVFESELDTVTFPNPVAVYADGTG